MPRTGTETEREAIEYVKAHKADLVRRFADPAQYPSVSEPVSFFMAGSPGAGKTEFSKSLVSGLNVANPGARIVRLDADEIRPFIPQFDGGNSAEVQAAASIGIARLFDHCHDKRLNMLLDGTFAHKVSMDNLERAIRKGRRAAIFYIYQDPLVAWDYTLKREAEEGRNVPKEAFVEAFLMAHNNVAEAKRRFGKAVNVDIVINNAANEVGKYYINVGDVDAQLPLGYDAETLRKLL